MSCLRLRLSIILLFTSLTFLSFPALTQAAPNCSAGPSTLVFGGELSVTATGLTADVQYYLRLRETNTALQYNVTHITGRTDDAGALRFSDRVISEDVGGKPGTYHVILYTDANNGVCQVSGNEDVTFTNTSATPTPTIRVMPTAAPTPKCQISEAGATIGEEDASGNPVYMLYVTASSLQVGKLYQVVLDGFEIHRTTPQQSPSTINVPIPAGTNFQTLHTIGLTRIDDTSDTCSKGSVTFSTFAVGSCTAQVLSSGSNGASQVRMTASRLPTENYLIKSSAGGENFTSVNVSTGGGFSKEFTYPHGGGPVTFIAASTDGRYECRAATINIAISPIPIRSPVDVTSTPTPIPNSPAGIKCNPDSPSGEIVRDKPETTNIDESVGALGIYTAIGCIPTQPQKLVQEIIKFATRAGGGIALLLMISGAFQILTAAGNHETMTKGKDQITSAAIGLLFVIFSTLLLQIIGVDILGVIK
ncbi:MAG: pilin [Candidatus Daviesbacteria bacterium]|nr:pilin [Candidatus Daviesbacteria bacterium]